MQIIKIALFASALGLTGHAAKADQTSPTPTIVKHHGTQWITTSEGCSYSRTQAPGYPVQWILILNPHHIGQPNAHLGCAPVLGG